MTTVYASNHKLNNVLYQNKHCGRYSYCINYRLGPCRTNDDGLYYNTRYNSYYLSCPPKKRKLHPNSSTYQHSNLVAIWDCLNYVATILPSRLLLNNYVVASSSKRIESLDSSVENPTADRCYASVVKRILFSFLQNLIRGFWR